MKKKIFIIVGIIVGVFLIYNAFWFGWRNIKYSQYIESMEQNPHSNFIVPRYAYTAEDGFTYFVKFPDYLSFTGNLSLGPPMDENLGSALLIWPQFNGEYSFGISISEEGGGYQFYIDSQGNAIDSQFDEVLERNRYDVDGLLNRAKSRWNIPE
jgi:hypothetical protein